MRGRSGQPWDLVKRRPLAVNLLNPWVIEYGSSVMHEHRTQGGGDAGLVSGHTEMVCSSETEPSQFSQPTILFGDLMTDWEFDIADFRFQGKITEQSLLVRDQAQAQLDKWLASAMTVYTVNSLFNMDSFTVHKTPMDKGHKALLIKIEEIKKCEHPKEKVQVSVIEFFTKGPTIKMNGTGFANNYFCQCGARVEPTEFKEVKA